jgi:hypothetical protein
MLGDRRAPFVVLRLVTLAAVRTGILLSLQARTATAAIRDAVTDSLQAARPGARVALRLVDTNVERVISSTGPDGRYRNFDTTVRGPGGASRSHSLMRRVGDCFIPQDVRVRRRPACTPALRLSLMAEALTIFNVANLTGYSTVLSQPNDGQPSARSGQVFGSGGPKAFQLAARLDV